MNPILDINLRKSHLLLNVFRMHCQIGSETDLQTSVKSNLTDNLPVGKKRQKLFAHNFISFVKIKKEATTSAEEEHSKMNLDFFLFSAAAFLS